MASDKHPILIVEDSDEDFEATQRAFDKVHLANKLYRCENGDDALDYLYQRGKYLNSLESPRPSVILMDLNMPGTDGREVLTLIKNDESLKMIPVVILTTSSFEKDIEACYALGANSYIVKPVNLVKFVEAMQRLKNYWFELVVLPKNP